MSVNSTLVVQLMMTGDGLGPGAVPIFSRQMTPNTNGHPPSAADLNAGINTIVVPSGVTINGCLIVPPSASTNSKTLKGVSGDTGFSGWTSLPVVTPCTAGGTFVIVSTGSETVELGWL